MSKRNREIAYIQDQVKKRNAKCKRSKNLMAKAQELSVLCNLKVNISFFDPTMNRVVEFASDPNFTMHDLCMRVMGESARLSHNKKIKHKLVTSDDIKD